MHQKSKTNSTEVPPSSAGALPVYAAVHLFDRLASPLHSVTAAYFATTAVRSHDRAAAIGPGNVQGDSLNSDQRGRRVSMAAVKEQSGYSSGWDLIRAVLIILLVFLIC